MNSAMLSVYLVPQQTCECLHHSRQRWETNWCHTVVWSLNNFQEHVLFLKANGESLMALGHGSGILNSKTWCGHFSGFKMKTRLPPAMIEAGIKAIEAEA